MSDTPEPAITVVIAAYNAGHFLSRAVNSVLDQGFAAFELLIVNDASTDNTLAVASEMAARHPQVRVLTLARNGGPAVARNAGFAAARGGWIAVLDADDAFLPCHLASLHDVAMAAQADVVLSNFAYYDSIRRTAGDPGVPTSPATTRTDHHDYVAHARPFGDQSDWGLLKPMFRADFLRQHGLHYPEHSRHGEDFLLMVDALLAGAAVIISARPSYLYSMRTSGWSRTRIDYDAQVAQTGALLADPRVAGDAKMEAALRTRMEALARLSAEWKVRGWWRERDIGAILVKSFADPRVRTAAARFTARKLRARLAAR